MKYKLPKFLTEKHINIGDELNKLFMISNTQSLFVQYGDRVECVYMSYENEKFDVVICNDSGLYFEELDFEDLRQPGLNIRTPMNMDRLSDEEMIDYYSKLIAGLGGKVTAYYLDGIAVYNHGVISSFMDNMAAQKNGLFYMIDKASSKRFEGWPLDSLSINKENGKYFVDGSIEESKENIIKDQYQKSVVDFLIKSLHIA